MTTPFSVYWKKEQAIIELFGKVKVGGYPGINPTLIVPSIFYREDKLLLNVDDGIIDKKSATEQIEAATNMAREHGLQMAIDVMFMTAKSVDSILPFISEFDLPLIIDSPDAYVRIRAYEKAKELGISDKCVANGIYVNTSTEELRAIRESGIQSAILIAFDPANPAASMSPESRITVLKDKLLPLAEEAGVRNILVDTAVLDLASIVLSAEAIYYVKKEFGLPAGCAPANALGSAHRSGLMEVEVSGIYGAVSALLRVYGADFIMYGPIELTKYIVSAIAMADSLLGYKARLSRHSLPSNHPVRKYLRRVAKALKR